MVRDFYNKCTIQLARLKMSNRSIHLTLDGERRKLDSRKTLLDQLQLTYENLLYQKTHVQKEIEKCKDLATPHTASIQAERGEPLGTKLYSENLEEIRQQAITDLKAEEESRIQMKKELESLELVIANEMMELNRKRKCLEELPDQVSKIRLASKDLSDSLSVMVAEILVAREKVAVTSEEDTNKLDLPTIKEDKAEEEVMEVDE